MDSDELRSILRDSGVDVWTLIDTAISVALMDDQNHTQIKNRRDGIVQRLYALPCHNCTNQHKPPPTIATTPTTTRPSSPTPTHSVDGDALEDEEEEEEEENHYGRPLDDEQIKILDIKEHLEDPNQSEDSLVNLLQDLADMDITFKALQETDIGRHVNLLRKHSSAEVRTIVKQLVRKWKDLVDQWVKSSSTTGGGGGNGGGGSSTIIDGDSPQARRAHHNNSQVPDFAYSPNLHNGSSGSDKNNSEPEPKPKVVPKREPPSKLTQSAPRQPKDNLIDPERLASARRRLHENYQEAQNAKKQRTIQVMDLQDIPKPKNTSYFGRNKGGHQAKHW